MHLSLSRALSLARALSLGFHGHEPRKPFQSFFDQPAFAGAPLSNALVARVRQVGDATKYAETVAKTAPNFFLKQFQSRITAEFSKVFSKSLCKYSLAYTIV